MSKATEKKAPKKTGLGRGLNSLLGGSQFDEEQNDAVEKVNFQSKSNESLNQGFVETDTPMVTHVVTTPEKSPEPTIPDTARIWNVAIEKIVANENQPRRIFEKEHLESLSKSIAEKGIIQPISVRKLEDGKFEIVAGERRWRSAQLAGMHEVPVIIKETDDRESLELALIENIQRQDLNPIEEAEAYFNMIKKYRLTQQELAEKLGKERVTLANVLRLLNLTPDVRKLVASNELSLGQAKVLVAVTDPKKQKSLAKKAIKNQLSVRALEKLVQNEKAKAEKPSLNQDQIMRISAVESLQEELRKSLGTKVSIDYAGGKGKIVMNFYSDDELNQLAEKIRESCNPV